MSNDPRTRTRATNIGGSRVAIQLYKKINRALAKREGVLDAYLTAIRPVLDWSDRQAAEEAQDADKR